MITSQRILRNNFSSIQSVKGMKDLVGKYIVDCGSKVLEKNGYNLIVQNILEHSSIFSRTLGDTSEIINKEMYGFKDQSGKELVLRPEGTASVVRHILENSKHFEQQQKYYYYGPMYRYERPQLGRQRQFYQLGCEYIHKQNEKNSYLIDAEIILLAHQFLSNVLGNKNNFSMEINTIGDMEDRMKYNEILKEYYQRNIMKLSELSKMRLERNNPLRIFDSKEIQDQELIANAPLFSDIMKQKNKEYFNNLLDILNTLNISYHINPLLVRGLDYYSHTCFEIKNINQQGKSQDTILAGGRYDSLATILNQKETNLNGVGFACGVERIGLLLQDDDSKLKEFEKKKIKIGVIPVIGKSNTMTEEQERKLKLYCMQLMKSISNDINDQSLEVQFILHTSKMDKQMEYLLKNEFKWGMFIGENEMKERTVSLKNLFDRESYTISEEQINNYNF